MITDEKLIEYVDGQKVTNTKRKTEYYVHLFKNFIQTNPGLLGSTSLLELLLQVLYDHLWIHKFERFSFQHLAISEQTRLRSFTIFTDAVF